MNETQPPYVNYFGKSVHYTESITDALVNSSRRKGVARYFLATDKDPDDKVVFGVQLEEGLAFKINPQDPKKLEYQENGLPIVIPLDTENPEDVALAQELTLFLVTLFLNT